MAEKRPDPNVEALARAVIDALMRSPKVRSALQDVADSEARLTPDTHLMLMLKLKNLAASLGVDLPEGVDGGDGKPMMSREWDMDEMTLALTDESVGLTEQERAFREFAADQFDQGEWLRKHRLRL